MKKHPEYGFVLLGDKADIPRARGVISKLEANGFETQRNIVSLVGETDFDLWASVIARCQWTFTCDTAAVHLASVLGTRVLDISVGPVRWTETGPYGNGHYIVSAAKACEACATADLKARAHTCRDDVTADAVYAAWSYASTEWSHRKQISINEHFEKLGLAAALETVQVHRSSIRNTQDGGGVVYEPLTKRPMQIGEWMAMAMGHIARAWYCGWVPPIGTELKRETISPSLIQTLRQLDESSLVLSKIAEEARKTASALNQKASSLKSDKIMPLKDREEIRKLGKKLSDLEFLAERLGKTTHALQGLVGISKVFMHNLKGDQMAELGKQAAECYRQTSEGVSILRDWISFTQRLIKPVAIRNKPEVTL